jgi:glycosyltransferase involved in cell wall biosynthesis
VSNAVSNYWIKNGLNKEKIITIHNGFNFNFKVEKKLSKSELVFCNISRIIPYKGHDFLIELFNELSKNRNDLILNIIGDTLPEYESYYNELKEKVLKYNLTNKINFIGYQSDVKKYLEKSHFFIHCPISPDPLPTVIFEAIESSTPVIFTKPGGAYEILDSGKNGLGIDHLSLKKSVESILQFIDNRLEQEKNVRNAKRFVKKNFPLNSFNYNLKTLISKIV